MASTEPGSARSPVAWRELVRATRPRQWSKNLLVFAAPLLSGRFTEREVLGNAAVAFVAFTLAASAVYLVNDVRDVESDRAHPTKRRRPVAAGTLERPDGHRGPAPCWRSPLWSSPWCRGSTWSS